MKIQQMVRHLVGWYETVEVMRFPGEEFQRFKAVVNLACNKRRKPSLDQDPAGSFTNSTFATQTIMQIYSLNN